MNLTSFTSTVARPPGPSGKPTNMAQFSNVTADVPGYTELQREIREALRAQHPEWIQPDGDCPTCRSYELRLAELLSTL